MVLRKRTLDNSARYIRISEKTKERQSKPKTNEAGALPRKRNKKISRNKKKFLENISAQGFNYITKKFLYKYKTTYFFIHI